MTMHEVRSIDALSGPVLRIERSLTSGRNPPTWLICGIEGTGKWALAMELAQALLCETPTPWGCDKCPACTRSTSFGHPDLFTLFPYPVGGGSGKAREKFQAEYIAEFLTHKRKFPLLPFPDDRNRYTPADRITELRSWTKFKPSEGSRKVALIYEPELIVRTVVDKLLKLAEEPPPGMTLILVSHKPESLPQTIRSRSRRVDVRRIGPDTLTEILVESGVAKAKAKNAARQAQGAIGVAMSLAAQEDQTDPVRDALELLTRILADDPRACADLQMWQWRAQRQRAQDTLDIWAMLVRDLACASYAAPLLGSRIEPWRKSLQLLADPERAERALGYIREAQAAIATNVHVGIALSAVGSNMWSLGQSKNNAGRFWPRLQNV